MITLVAEFLFAVIFLRALVAFLNSRDPIQRDLTLVFVGPTAIFVNDVVRQILGHRPPTIMSVIATILLLAQPYLTLRLASRLLRVPRWVRYAMITAYLVAAVPATVAPRPLSPALVVLVIGMFVITELAAAVLFVLAARRRTGAARARLRVAGYATILFAAAIAMIGVSALTPTWYPMGVDAQEVARGASRVLSLLSGVAYVVTFIPPRWLRRFWSATASSTVIQRLLRSPATDDGGQTWQRYAEVVQAVADADAVVILVRDDDDRVRQIAVAGTSVIGPADGGPTVDNWRALDDLLRAKQPIAIDGKDRSRPLPLAGHYAQQVEASYVKALPLKVSPDRSGALLLLNRHRTLFPDDDRRLMAELGAQAAVLAQRGDLLAEQRHLTQRLEESVTALTAASQAKSDFLANMSHELRTPLNAIIGFSELMRGEGTGDTRAVPADWVEHVHSSGRHLLGLINDILDLAKVEAGRLDLHIESIPLELAVTDVMTALGPLIDAKRITAEIDVPPLTASADPIRFRQILDNLLSNAIKFTPEEGRISISAARADGDVELRVIDNGVGIDAADHERVFEEFRQVGDMSKRQAGTGLGLALTRRLVQAHGGSIGLRSALGKGTEFRVRLPAGVPERADETPAHEYTGAAAGRGRVLLIEDDVRAAELVRTYLNNAGYDVMLAGSGETGLALAASDPPDAIMLDIDLPGIDGWEVLRRLKADSRSARIPVFFSTVLDERQAGLALGATDYFIKPINHEVLLSQLARHVLPAPSERSTTVLVVEPDAETRRIVTDNLRADGIGVVSCGDGADVPRLTSEHHFDLVICDLQTPGTNGFSLLSALDADPATRAIPVLALTGTEMISIAGPQSPNVVGAAPDFESVSDSLANWLSSASSRSAAGFTDEGRGRP